MKSKKDLDKQPEKVKDAAHRYFRAYFRFQNRKLCTACSENSMQLVYQLRKVFISFKG